MRVLQAHKKGTIFLIHGASGVRMTVLIDVLAKEVTENRWKIADLYPNALWSPDDLLRLGKKTSVRVTGAPVKAGVDQFVKASADVPWRSFLLV